MANLNLSEFTEKFFVADADHTFIWDTAASISKRVSRNSWLNSGTLTSDAPVTISQTWNQIGTTFTAFKVNAVSTASASGSLLLDLQVGGVSQFKVDKSGVATLSTDGVPQLRMISVTGSGSVFNGLTLESSLSTLAGFLVNRSTGEVKIGGLSNAGYFPTFYSNNAERMRITTAGNVGIGTTAPGAKLQVVGNAIFGENITQPTGSPINVSFGGTYATGVPGTKANLKWDLYRDASGDSSRTGIGISAGLMEFQGGSGAGFGFYPNNSTTSALHIISSGNVGIGTTSPTSKLHVAGNSSPSITVDNTLATGASQLLFKNTVVTGDTDGIFLNGSAQSGFGGNGSLNIKATTGPIAFHTNTVTNAFSIAQNGVVTTGRIIVNTLQLAQILNSNDSKYFWEFSTASEIATFARLQTAPIMQFAGTTNLFPAIKRSTVRLQARLADDSGFTNIQGKLTTDTAFDATVVTPTGFITLYDSTGTAYKVPCVPA